MKLNQKLLNGDFFSNLNVLFSLYLKERGDKYNNWKIGIVDQVGHNVIEVVSEIKIFKVNMFPAGGSAALRAMLPNPLRIDEAFRIVFIKPEHEDKDILEEGDFLFAGKIWFNQNGYITKWNK